LKTDNKCK